MTHLLDANVLIALVSSEHTHQAAARAGVVDLRWFATSPTVQGTLLRYLLRQGMSGVQCTLALEQVLGAPRHEQWLDDLTYAEVDLSRVLGHRQVTHAYLAQLARSRGGRVVTFDRGFAAAAPDVVDLLS